MAKKIKVKPVYEIVEEDPLDLDLPESKEETPEPILEDKTPEVEIEVEPEPEIEVEEPVEEKPPVPKKKSNKVLLNEDWEEMESTFNAGYLKFGSGPQTCPLTIKHIEDFKRFAKHCRDQIK